MSEGRAAAEVRATVRGRITVKVAWWLALWIALLVCCCAVTVRAQTGFATLSGTVMDPEGRVVLGVGVSATNVDTGVATNAMTNSDGIYVLPALQPGRYRVIVTKQGFKQIALTDITLNTQDSVSRNFNLEVGAVSETVTVNSNNERMPTDDPAVGLLVSRDFVENMPLNGRSFQDLIALAPGAVTSPDSAPNVGGTFNINGQHDDANYFTVDGVAANLNSAFDPRGLAGAYPAQTVLGTTQSLVSLDGLQEFKIQTSGYTAEDGRQPGGQIELTTRSGTNDFHGSAFDYLRNTVFDANDWFLKQAGVPRQPERQNDFGGTIGGPLWIPRVYDGKNRTFFFVSYEGLRLVQPSGSSISDVPTPQFREFAGPGVQPFLNADPLPNVKGHLENGDQCAATLDPNYPNLPPGSPYGFSCTGEFIDEGGRNPRSLNSTNARLDQNIGTSSRLFLRFFDSPSQFANQGDGISGLGKGSTWGITLGATEQLSSRIVNETRFNYSSNEVSRTQTLLASDGSIPYPRSLMLPQQYVNSAAGSTILQFTIPNADFFSVPGYDDISSSLRQYNVVDGVSFQCGPHLLKFGVDYRRIRSSQNPRSYTAEFDFLSLTGIQQSYADNAVITAAKVANPIFNNVSLYFQDHWRVTGRLTLDVGVRWEINPPPGASDGQYPLALTSSNLAMAQIAPSGTPQYRTRYSNLAPRLGFAYALRDSPSHPTILRVGSGIFFDTGQSLGATGYFGYPFNAFNQFSNLPLPASAASLAPPSLTFPLTQPYGVIEGISVPNLRLPYTAQWNLSLDQGLTKSNTLTMSYVGNVGEDLLFQRRCIELCQTNPAFSLVFLNTNDSSSSYNAVQIQDTGYLAPGMRTIVSYTWAHAIDNVSADIVSPVPIRGNSDNDIKQVANIALNYAIPVRSENRFVRGIASGWSLDGQFTANSGTPLNVVQGYWVMPNGQFGIVLPNLNPGVPIYLHNVPNAVGGWGLNAAAFSDVPTDPNTGAPLVQGDLGRNQLFGPAFWNLNVAAQKDVRLTEKAALQIRVDAFNLFNHINAGGIDTSLGDSTFGISNSGTPTIGVPNGLYATGSARSFQFMLKLKF